MGRRGAGSTADGAQAHASGRVTRAWRQEEAARGRRWGARRAAHGLPPAGMRRGPAAEAQSLAITRSANARSASSFCWSVVASGS